MDKTGMIGLINQTIGTPQCLTCISRPRRFGKSFAAQMLCAYYDKTCDSSGLFDDLAIASDAQYRAHLNQYDVIYLDMTGVIGEASGMDIVPYIQRNVVRELTEQYPKLRVVEGFAATLANAVEAAGNKFVMLPQKAPLNRSATGDIPGLSVDTAGRSCWWGSAMTRNHQQEREGISAGSRDMKVKENTADPKIYPAIFRPSNTSITFFSKSIISKFSTRIQPCCPSSVSTRTQRQSAEVCRKRSDRAAGSTKVSGLSAEACSGRFSDRFTQFLF